MQRSGFRRLLFAVCAAVLAFAFNGNFSVSPTPVVAQSVPRPNVAVSIYDTPVSDQPPTTSALASFSPGNATMKKLTDLAPDAIMDISPDGKRIAVTGGDNQDQDQLAYGVIGAPLTVVQVTKDHRVLWAAFSPNGRYLSYTTASLDNDTGEWLLGIIEISSGKKIEFTGNFNESGQQTFTGAGDAVGWSPDGKRLYLRTYMPFSANGGYDNLYSLDLSGVSFDKPGRFPLPAATRILQQNEQMVNFAFTDDGSRLAVMFTDPANPPSAMQGTDTPPNIVSVRDIATGNELLNFHSDKGQALEFPLTWTPDGQKLFFAGGSFKDTSFIVTPTLYTADTSSKQPATSPLFDDPIFGLESAVACTGTLYFVAAKDNPADGSHTAILYSAPLSDLKTKTKLATSSYINLLNCIAVS